MRMATKGEAGVSVAGTLWKMAEARPNAAFLTFDDRTMTYGQVATESRALAVGLRNLGIEPGDRIAINLPNWPEFVVTCFAAAELGATIVPLNPGFAPRELQYLLRTSEATVAVTAETYRDTDYLQLFESLLTELPDLQYLVTVGEEDLWYDDRIFQFEDMISSGRGRESAPAQVDPEESTFAIIFTPGTAGTSKGVMLSHENLLRTAGATARALALEPTDVTLCCVPMFHIFGLGAALLPALASGSHVVLQERFEPDEAFDLIERHGVTVLHGVPTMFVMLLREPERAQCDLSSLRTGIVAGAPVREEVATAAREELVANLEIAYGLTETSPTVSITSPADDGAKRSQTVGRPLEGVELRVLDEQGESLPPEAVGEVAVRGFNVMKGYFRQPSQTADAFTADGFLKTGDLGMIDEAGYLHIVGRRSDVIIRGGYNVQPREIENHLRSHPGVDDAVVLGLPNDVLGELVCACVVAVEGALLTEDELLDYCDEAVADYKVPDLIRFFEVFPDESVEARRVTLARLVRAEVKETEEENV
jgi:acyl-CoA synthetase (AMP-forming)/AMP-acid ligase II